jgi:hydrogenase/urease accessory protein HupE
VNLQAAFPARCVYHAPTLSCKGLSKLVIQFGDLPPHAEVVLHHISSTGEEQFQVINNGKATLSFHVEQNSFWNTAAHYAWIGVEHILLGPDHLLFVFGMLLLTGFHHRLIWAVTAFTISHSLSLALSMFGWLAVPAVPVEIIIALSIVFVAREALTSSQTLAKRQPWLVAFLFGLIHGLGFASALSDIGLPAQQEATALLAFNLGVEAGQLLALFVLYVTHRAAAAVDTRWWHRCRRYASYAIGIAGSFWLAERTVSAIT